MQIQYAHNYIIYQNSEGCFATTFHLKLSMNKFTCNASSRAHPNIAQFSFNQNRSKPSKPLHYFDPELTYIK